MYSSGLVAVGVSGGPGACSGCDSGQMLSTTGEQSTLDNAIFVIDTPSTLLSSKFGLLQFL